MSVSAGGLRCRRMSARYTRAEQLILRHDAICEGSVISWCGRCRLDHHDAWVGGRSLVLPAMTTQLMMPVPPLSLNRYLFDDDRARLGERHGLCAVMPSSVSKRTNNDREEQYFF
jgi:hypothetical protein